MSKFIFPALLFFIFAEMLNGKTCLSAADTQNVQYFGEVPEIDGRPDAFTGGLKENAFGKITASSEKLQIPDASYKIAYNINSLYLLIKIDSDSVTYRDRA